jgi:heme exporter protein A
MEQPAPGAAIEASGLIKRFGAISAIDGLTFSVASGESLVLFGPNGAGKTTLVRLLTGSLRLSSGSYAIGGLDPDRDDLEVRSLIGLISHQSFLYDDLTARQNLAFFARLYGVRDAAGRAESLLREMELASRADDAVGDFSRGMQQRVSLARALVHEPALLFLDEPFTGLDPHAARMLRSTLMRIRGERRTILMTTHDLALGLELSDRWMILSGGRIVEQGASAATDPELFRQEYFELLGSGGPA